MSTDFVTEAATVLEGQGLPFIIISALAEDKTYRMFNLYENKGLIPGRVRRGMVLELRNLADHLENKGDLL